MTYARTTVWYSRSTGIVLWMHPANERRRDIVTSSFIGWTHTQNNLCNTSHELCPQFSQNCCFDTDRFYQYPSGFIHWQWPAQQIRLHTLRCILYLQIILISILLTNDVWLVFAVLILQFYTCISFKMTLTLALANMRLPLSQWSNPL